MEKIRAISPQYAAPVTFQPRHDGKPVFYVLHEHAVVTTSNISKKQLNNAHTMVLVHVRSVADLNDPSNDVAANVGTLVKRTKSGKVDPLSPELWFWNNKFWMKAVDTDGIPYYRTHGTEKCYAFCEVEIDEDTQSTILGQLADVLGQTK